MTTPHVTVFGAGSIGCYLGGRLIEGGAAVRLIGRPRIADDIARHGLALSQFAEPVTTIEGVDYQTDEGALAGARIVALCVKSQATPEAARAIREHAPDAWVVSFQNGVSNLSVLREALPDQRISGCVVPFNVTSPGPGHFHRGTVGELLIGPNAPPVLMKALELGGVAAREVDDIEGHLWAKLLVNLNNALNALSGGPLRDGLVQRGYRRVLVAMIEEGLRVADAEGVRVATFNGRSPDALLRLMRKPDWIYRIVMDRVVKIDRTARSSMLDDLELGRAPELDHLQGEIVRRADAHGIEVPVNRAVMAAVRDAFAQRETPRLSGAQMNAAFLK
ncbi:MAG: 2-dehydropantoate 2-reductase [Litorimonas sp.]